MSAPKRARTMTIGPSHHFLRSRMKAQSSPSSETAAERAIVPILLCRRLPVDTARCQLPKDPSAPETSSRGGTEREPHAGTSCRGRRSRRGRRAPKTPCAVPAISRTGSLEPQSRERWRPSRECIADAADLEPHLVRGACRPVAQQLEREARGEKAGELQPLAGARVLPREEDGVPGREVL